MELSLRDLQKEIISMDGVSQEYMMNLYEKSEFIYEALQLKFKEVSLKQAQLIKVDKERKVIEKIQKKRYDKQRKNKILKNNLLLDEFAARNHREIKRDG